ncbi:MAG: isochorismatase family protein [Aquincola tertiaricarbonis]
MSLASTRRALVVIDVQNEYIDGRFRIEHPAVEQSLGNIHRAMDVAERHGVPIVVVQHLLPPTAPIFAEGTPGADLHPSIASRPHAHLVRKCLPSVFAGTDLREWLARREINTLAICGYMTHQCDESTIRQALHEGYQVEFLADAAGSLSYANKAGQASAEQIHSVACVVLQSSYAAVVSTDEWSQALASGRDLERDDVFSSHQRALSLATAGTASRTLSAETRFVEVSGATIAYRDLGPRHGTPLMMINRFRGTMDHWDPLLVDRIAAERRVILFDQPGFARSVGTPPDHLSGFAANVVALAGALGIAQFDAFGFSMGGTVALQLLLDHPRAVRRAVVAGSAPGHVPGDLPSNQPAGQEVWSVATKPVNTDEDFLYLFFEPSPASQQAGRNYLARLAGRADAFSHQVDAQAWQAQLKSAMGVREAATSLLPRLKEIGHPVLVANGRHDIMAPTYASYAMAQELPRGWLKVFPDAGHGFLFQHAQEFADDVLRFLR